MQYKLNTLSALRKQRAASRCQAAGVDRRRLIDPEHERDYFFGAGQPIQGPCATGRPVIASNGAAR